MKDEHRLYDIIPAERKTQMIEELKNYLGIETHAAFGRFLGISSQSAFAWLSRGAFNAELVASKCPEVSGDWLLTGEGPMLKKDRFGTGILFNGTNTCSNDGNPAEIKRLVAALMQEQKLTEKAQMQSDRLLEILHELSRNIGQKK